MMLSPCPSREKVKSGTGIDDVVATVPVLLGSCSQGAEGKDVGAT